MLRLTVLYGHPQDTAAFDRHYAEVHAPLAAKVPGLRGFSYGVQAPLDAAERSPYYLAASLYFESADTLQAGLASPEGRAAVADLQNFATGGVTILTGEEQVVVSVTLTQSTPVQA